MGEFSGPTRSSKTRFSPSFCLCLLNLASHLAIATSSQHCPDAEQSLGVLFCFVLLISFEGGTELLPKAESIRLS